MANENNKNTDGQIGPQSEGSKSVEPYKSDSLGSKDSLIPIPAASSYIQSVSYQEKTGSGRIYIGRQSRPESNKLNPYSKKLNKLPKLDLANRADGKLERKKEKKAPPEEPYRLQTVIDQPLPLLLFPLLNNSEPFDSPHNTAILQFVYDWLAGKFPNPSNISEMVSQASQMSSIFETYENAVFSWKINIIKGWKEAHPEYAYTPLSELAYLDEALLPKDIRTKIDDVNREIKRLVNPWSRYYLINPLLLPLLWYNPTSSNSELISSHGWGFFRQHVIHRVIKDEAQIRAFDEETAKLDALPLIKGLLARTQQISLRQRWEGQHALFPAQFESAGQSIPFQDKNSLEQWLTSFPPSELLDYVAQQCLPLAEFLGVQPPHPTKKPLDFSELVQPLQTRPEGYNKLRYEFMQNVKLLDSYYYGAYPVQMCFARRNTPFTDLHHPFSETVRWLRGKGKYLDNFAEQYGERHEFRKVVHLRPNDPEWIYPKSEHIYRLQDVLEYLLEKVNNFSDSLSEKDFSQAHFQICALLDPSLTPDNQAQKPSLYELLISTLTKRGFLKKDFRIRDLIVIEPILEKTDSFPEFVTVPELIALIGGDVVDANVAQKIAELLNQHLGVRTFYRLDTLRAEAVRRIQTKDKEGPTSSFWLLPDIFIRDYYGTDTSGQCWRDEARVLTTHGLETATLITSIWSPDLKNVRESEYRLITMNWGEKTDHAEEKAVYDRYFATRKEFLKRSEINVTKIDEEISKLKTKLEAAEQSLVEAKLILERFDNDLASQTPTDPKQQVKKIRLEAIGLQYYGDLEQEMIRNGHERNIYYVLDEIKRIKQQIAHLESEKLKSLDPDADSPLPPLEAYIPLHVRPLISSMIISLLREPQDRVVDPEDISEGDIDKYGLAENEDGGKVVTARSKAVVQLMKCLTRLDNLSSPTWPQVDELLGQVENILQACEDYLLKPLPTKEEFKPELLTAASDPELVDTDPSTLEHPKATDDEIRAFMGKSRPTQESSDSASSTHSAAKGSDRENLSGFLNSLSIEQLEELAKNQAPKGDVRSRIRAFVNRLLGRDEQSVAQFIQDIINSKRNSK